MFTKSIQRTSLLLMSLLLAVFCLFTAQTANAASQQQASRQLTGQVVDGSGVPVAGADVLIVGTKTGTATDANGNYVISVRRGDVLSFSFIGFIAQTVTVADQTVINVILNEDTQVLDEVVMIGYGSVKKSSLTGALSQVTNDAFKDQKVTRIDQALQGRAAGVQVSNTVGAPGGDVRIRVRGANSVLGDNSPLFVIDGFVGADYNALNPNDIKSIEVLKDAASTAIYGSRGANGVILVTTKNGGTDGKTTLSYSGSVSASKIIKNYDVLSAGQYAEQANAHDIAFGANPKFTAAQIADYYKNGGFDYLGAVLRTAISQEHEVNVAGGNKNTQFRISGDYNNQQGIIERSDYTKYTVRANVNTKVTDKLNFRFNLNGTQSVAKNNQARTGAGNPLVQALAWAPTTDPYTTDGNYLQADPTGSIKSNPLAMLYDQDNIYDRTFINILGGANYEIIKGLSIDFQAAADLLFSEDKGWSGTQISNGQPSAYKNDYRAHTYQTTTQLTYNRTFGEHSINAVAALETQQYEWTSLTGSADKLKFPDLKYDNLAQAGSTKVGTDYSMWSLLSYLGRVNYSYANKYLASVSVRRDGSSKFADGHKYSTFPAVALAWNAGNEDFVKNLDIFSKLKVRASWGLTGSQAISPYATLSAYNSSIYYAFTTGTRTNGIMLGNPANTDLKWETTEQYDLGLETGFWNDRLTVEADYFVKNTRDLLLNKSVSYYQGGGSIVSNVGKIRNRGFELNITGQVISTKDMSLESTLNFSYVKNKVVNLGAEKQIQSNTNINGLNGQAEFVYQVGKPLASFWGLKYLGPWQKDEATEAAKYGCVPGDARYEDLNGDNQITGSDYQIIGCGLPKFTLGWNNSFTYKHWSVNAFFQGVFGIDKLNYTRCLHMMASRDARYATLSEALDRYIPGKQEDAYLPAWSPTSRWEPASTLFLEDASYLRLKNLSVAYNFKLRKVGDITVSLNGTNLLTFTGYKGLDPEASNVGGGSSDIRQGIDYGAYPNSKTVTLGVGITF